MGDCRHCGKPAGLLRRRHRDCEDVHRRGRRRVVELAADAAASDEFSEAALVTLARDIAAGAFMGEDVIRAAIAEGWCAAVRESLADGIVTQQEEARLRAFRDRLALGDAETLRDGDRLDQAVRERLGAEAQRAAVANEAGRLDAFASSLGAAELTADERRQLAIDAWETAVERALEDGVLSLDEEGALIRYLRRFDLCPADVNGNGAHRSMIEAAMIREAAEGLVPDRLGEVQVPFNLMKSERLVWVIDDVDYLETRVRRERRGSSHGLSIRIARGVYYRPGMFRSRPIEWEETVHEDTGLFGVTTKHIYFHGGRRRFRVRLDRIVSFEPYDDGIGIMRDAQTARPQTFRTGDGWFAYNLVTNVARNAP